MTTAKLFQPLYNTIWDKRKIPDDWNQSIIIKIPKKGPLSECSNWHVITLLSTNSKIPAKVIMKHLSLAVDHKLREEQAGFRRRRGCIDQIFTLRNINEQATILMRRRWRWIGHVTRQEVSIAKTALRWKPKGKRKRGRPKITWRRTVEKEIKDMGKTWGGIKLTARDRQMWRKHVAALHAT